MDIAVEPVCFPQNTQRLDHQLRGVVGTSKDTGGQEKPLDIVSPVKSDGQLRQLLRGKRCPPCVVAAAVDAIFAVVYAPVGQQDLQQRDASPIRRKRVAAARQRGRGVADVSLPVPPPNAGGGAGGIVFCSVRENRQLFQQLHGTDSARPGAPGMARGTLNGVDDAKKLMRQKAYAHQNKKQCPASHG
ncbi:hypothetical protein SDC9_133493 [bioreactor metagenome]|uniref:Uncharacterized protein n=1 Tax=bioreactor metagenome TaxID=1076179 RepID=A0A645DAN0_9ZZZZ